MEEINEPKKDYCEPMHTAEHILNQTMIREFGCKRSMNAHIEKKKSKCDYFLAEDPGMDRMKVVEQKVNEVIKQQLPVTIDYMPRTDAAYIVDLSKLPDDSTDTLRIVLVGDYDVCACIGAHVNNTSEIGKFCLLNYNYENGRLRLRFKLV